MTIKGNLTWFIIGAVVTAAVWWATEKILDKHIGPRFGFPASD